MVSKRINKLKEINKDYYTILDLEKILGLKRKSLLVQLCRWQSKNEIRRLATGVYQLTELPLNYEKIATQIYQPSYISFETVLSKFGILSQIPYTLTLATLKKPKKMVLADKSLEYRRLKKELFFGFNLKDGIYIAEPEKALLDQLYLVSKGRATLNYRELDLKDLSKPEFARYAKKYPKPTQKLAKKLMSSFGRSAITIE